MIGAQGERGYQLKFSENNPEMHSEAGRLRKANTMVQVLREHLQQTAERQLLDVGSSTGFTDHYLAQHFGSVHGIDIDKQGVRHAQQSFQRSNLTFTQGDAMALAFEEHSFDVVICTHVYEHVPSATKLMAEIYRVLKPGGVCYFSAGNRLQYMEPHYQLPMLSWPPKWIANLYRKMARRGSLYYEEHLTYWGLAALTSRFKRHDYTEKLVLDPIRYGTDYMIPPGSQKQRVARALLKFAYPLFPGLHLVIRKTSHLS